MPINHKFLNYNWNNGFQTNNVILNVTPYEPEVLFIGTYNPDTSGQQNLAGFFYGRDNYLIPLLHGIFNLNKVYNQFPPYDNILWPLCNQLQLSFADLISCVFPNHVVPFNPNTNEVTFNTIKYNLIKDNDLLAIDKNLAQIKWNDDAIIEYINKNPTIKFVYLTQKGKNKFSLKFQQIEGKCIRKNISFRCIHTPSGQSLPGLPKELFLSLQWLIQQDQGAKKYGFDTTWLHQHNIHQFTHNGFILNF